MRCRDNEFPRSFSKRKTCSEPCRVASIAQSNSGRKRNVPPGTGNRRAYFVDEKPCSWCGKAMTRPVDLPPYRFAKQKTCSMECNLLQRGANNPRKIAFPTKECVICGNAFDRRPRELAENYRRRTTCTKVCKGKLIARNRTTPLDWKERVGPQFKVVYEPKPCVVCGREMVQDMAEKSARFKNRMTCSRTCRSQLIVASRRLKVTHSPYTAEFSSMLKRSIRERDGNRCVFCESTQRLSVHHINYQKHDCRPDNLLTVCTPCHTKTTFGDRSDWYFKCRAILVERGIIQAEELAA